jgi:hypothetical protein
MRIFRRSDRIYKTEGLLVLHIFVCFRLLCLQISTEIFIEIGFARCSLFVSYKNPHIALWPHNTKITPFSTPFHFNYSLILFFFLYCYRITNGNPFAAFIFTPFYYFNTSPACFTSVFALCQYPKFESLRLGPSINMYIFDYF